jgi:pSer/pThr/pTyr-binding forkhead associated (FHA) protein
MSAIIVLIIRILMVACIYGFLGFALIAMWRELKRTTEQQTATARPTLSLTIDGTENLQFSQPEILIGRSVENDIQVIDETVSQQHARIFFQNNHWMLEDSQSTNGTFLNGDMIHSAAVLIEEDRIDIGNKTIVVNPSKGRTSN